MIILKMARNIILLLIILIILGSNCSCSSIDKARAEIAEKLLKDFKVYIEKKPTYHNLVLASDKANGILGIYKDFLKQEDIQWVSQKHEQIKRSLHFSTVYFGYSRSGLYFIALAQPQLSHNYDYEEVMNSIRGLEDETVFLSKIGFLPSNDRYYALELYVEDLLENKKELSIDVLLTEKEGEVQKPICNPNNPNFNSLLLQFNRSFDGSKIIKSKGWKLFLFRKAIGYPTITIKCNKEEIILSH